MRPWLWLTYYNFLVHIHQLSPWTRDVVDEVCINSVISVDGYTGVVFVVIDNVALVMYLASFRDRSP